MRFALPSRSTSLQTLETLLLGLGGGLVFAWLNLPGGLISGAMITVAVAALAGRPLGMPPLLTQTVLVLLGISLGSLVSRQMLHDMSAYPLTLALLALATCCVMLGSAIYLQRVHAWDRTSALLAGSPGALSQIVMLATERNANVAGIAVVQTIRVIILTAGLPLLLALGGLSTSTSAATQPTAAAPLELLAMAAAAVAGALLLRWIRFPASWMFGAMLGSALLHGSGAIEGGLPPSMRAAALIGIGALIGTRFAKISARTMMRYVGAALGSFAVALAISAVFVAVVFMITDVRFGDIVVAFAPGAMDAMLALALTLHIDPVFVGAHHLARYIFVSIATPGIVHLFDRPQRDADD